MNRLSIRWRITLWNTVAFAVVLAGFGVLVYGLLRKIHYDQVDRGLQARHAELEEAIELGREPAAAAVGWVGRLEKRGYVDGLVRDPEGRVVASAGAWEGEPPEPVMSDAPPRIVSWETPGGGSARRLDATFSTPEGPFRMTVVQRLDHVEEELDQVIGVLVFTVPVTLLIAGCLAYVLAWKALSPVDGLRRLADEITAERLDRRLPVPNSGDELGHLAQTLNSMIGRLEHSFDEVRRFTADASHELRTPIAVIRSEAEMGAEVAHDRERARERFESILEECGRLASMTGQLLTLSRQDAGITRSSHQRLGLTDIVREVVDSIRSLATAAGIDIAADLADDVWVSADAEQLRQAIRNLIDNAIKYSDRGDRTMFGSVGPATRRSLKSATPGSGSRPSICPVCLIGFIASRETVRGTTAPGSG